ncbi:hypothetical protein ACFL2V_20600 [Pseudomonadota bacterium]
MSDKDDYRDIKRILAESLLADGVLELDDLKNEETIESKLKSYIKGRTVYTVYDHTETLLDKANEFRKAGDLDLAIVLYSTYFEHELNRIIEHVLCIDKVSKKSRVQLIRSININGKCSWLLEVLGLPSFNKKHSKSISDLSSERNSFIHYKWSHSIDLSGEEEKLELLDSAKSTSTYMKKYSSRVLYKGKKGKVKKALTKRTS